MTAGFMLMHAYKGAGGAFADFYAWCKDYPGNTEENVGAKWESVTSSTVGWHTLSDEARSAGWFDHTLAAEFDDLPPDTEDGVEARRLNERPQVRTSDRSINSIATAGLAALAKRPDQNIYQFGDYLKKSGMVTRVTQTGPIQLRSLLPVNVTRMRTALECSARFGTIKKPKDSAAIFVETPCPKDAAAHVVELGDWPMLRQLTGFTSCPLLRAEGTILNTPGHDPKTGLLFIPNGTEYPAIPAEPTEADARAALAVLLEPISLVPYVGDAGEMATGMPSASRSVALAAMLSPLARFAVGNTPALCFTSPRPGDCKSLHADIAFQMLDGKPCPVYTVDTTEQETTKTIKTALISGDELINLNNVTVAIGANATLNSALTDNEGGYLTIRLLGRLEPVRVPGNRVFVINGVNLSLLADMIRRVVLCRIDSRLERPEAKHFPFNPRDMVHDRRGAMVSAALTIMRWHFVAYGGDLRKMQPAGKAAMANFERWSAMVRGALVALGEPDPVATQETIRASDESTGAGSRLLTTWHGTLSDGWAELKDFMESGKDEHSALVTALRDYLESKGKTRDEDMSTRSVGRFLGLGGLTYAGLRLESLEQKGGHAKKWRVVKNVAS